VSGYWVVVVERVIGMESRRRGVRFHEGAGGDAVEVARDGVSGRRLVWCLGI
jgi:hypothetical protein